MADDEIKGLTQSVKELIGIHKENPLQKTVDNLNGEMDAKDKEIAALKAEIEDLKAKLGKVDNILAEQEKTRKDTQWAQVKNLYQPVMFHKPEDEAAHRLSFEKDPVAFQLANVGNLAPTGTKPKAEGKEAVGNVGGADQPFDIVAARGKLNPTTGRYE
jgi:seryl-tRNA synthetase